MNIENINIREIKPYERNPRINKEAVQFVANSIKEFGFKQPIVLDKNNIIIAGHTRYLASKKLKLKEVPCVYADDLTDEQVKAYRIADNSTAEVSQWDLDLLKLEIDEMPEIDFKADYGLDVAIEDVEEQVEIIEDEVPEINEKETIAQLGDIWQLGRHFLMCGDSTDAGSVALLMNGKNVDVIYTDPPYGINAVSKSGVLSKNYDSDIIGYEDNLMAINSFVNISKLYENSMQFWWGANYYSECLPSSECWIVWNKKNGNSDQTDAELAWSNARSVVRMFTMASEKTNRVHPTQKPVKLFAEIINNFKNKGNTDNILDLFGGSGSTLIACEQTNRTCFMMELDPKYIDVILYRYFNLTGDEPTLDGVLMSEIKQSRGV